MKLLRLKSSKTGLSLGLGFFAALLVLVTNVGASGRVANSTLALPQNPPVSGYSLTNAFGDLAFEQPVAVVSPPGEINRLFVLERKGRIMVITNLANPTKTVFLDLTPDLESVWLESGLLGMAFHPGYATNHYFYVYRTVYTSSPLATDGFHDELSRFQISPDDANRALPESELRLIAQLDDSDAHNAGDVQFGPDGYLYLSLGDSGPPASELSVTKQPIDKSFFGAILRIDVDKRPGNFPPNPHPASTTNYAIPADNPFIGVTNYQGIAVNPNEVRTEFFALGFRNPWRMSFDPITGALYCGEVGNGEIEEVNLISSGGNYGWPYLEGKNLTPLITDAPPEFKSIEPILTFTHGNATNQSRAIIGGIVYRGDRIPQLYGKYLFADNVFGHVWAASSDGTNQPNSFDWLASDPGISAFGRDPRNGDVLVVNYHHGRIQRLIYVAPEDAAPFPQTLADTGAFADLVSLTPNPGILPYKINVPFWSDNAIKSRWFSVPDADAKIGFNSIGNWMFPNGTVWIKHFELELTNGVTQSRRRIETRFIVKNDGGVYGVTYRWDDSQTNALLVDAAGMDESFSINESGTIRSQKWRYPSRAECLFCHSAAAGQALGFNTWQLNCDNGNGGEIENQIARLSDMGYFQNSISNVNELPALAHATNDHYSIGFRVRSYFAANCAQCHQPGGSFTLAAQWDGRITTLLNDTHLLPSLIKPNAPEESGLLSRISNQDVYRMPPVGSTVLDTNSIALLRKWILSFPPAPWKSQDIGNVGREGDSAAFDTAFQLSASGVGFGGNADQFQFLYQSLSGNGQIIARVASQEVSLAQAGITFRDSLAVGSKNATFIFQSETNLVFQHRLQTDSETTSPTIAIGTSQEWLRLVREGDVFTAYCSTNGASWNEFASQTVALTNDALAGLTASSGDNAALSLADFDHVSLMSLRIRIGGGELVAPAKVSIIPEITSTGNPVARVEFFVGAEKIGETIQEPFTLVWTNAPFGLHQVRARASDSMGAAVWSETVEVGVGIPEASATYITSDRTSRGNWQGTVGTDGYSIAGHATNLPFYAEVTVNSPGISVWETNSLLESGLENTGTDGRIASAWEAPESFTIDLQLQYGQFRRVSFYFLDWNGDNQRKQTIEVLDANDSVLYNRSITNFSAGKYLVLLLRGHVKIRVTATGESSAVLSGIFFDTEINDPPVVSIANPGNGQSFILPGTITIEADASDSDSAISKVEFFCDETKIGELTNSPYRFVWNNPLAGTHLLTARASDEFGAAVLSEAVAITATLPLANAVFLRADEATQGSWRGNYGFDGYAIATHATNLPSFLSLGSELPRDYIWSNSTADARALDYIEGDGRIAATWVEVESFTLDLQLRDGKNHRVALYFLDWDRSGRNLEVTLSDAATGRVLDAQPVTNLLNGKYYVWNLRGDIKVQIKRGSGANAILSGIFIDPDTNIPPTIRLTNPLAGTILTAPNQLLLAVETSDDHAISKVEYFADNKKIGDAVSPPFQFLWQVLADAHSLIAKAIDSDGAATDSEPVQISVQAVNSTAQFLGEDSATHGDWKGVYGALGYDIIHESENYPPFATASVSGKDDFIWTDYTTDARAPRTALNPGRIAGCWVSPTNFVIDLSLGDGLSRKVSFYSLDWDRSGREQTFKIRDADSGAVLDTRTLHEFQEGKYLSWQLRGHVTIEISANVGNAVLSCLFFDPFEVRIQQSPLVMLVNGDGIITPNLNGRILETGKSFSVEATPAANSVFKNWTDSSGNVLSSSPALTFVMQSNLFVQANFVPKPIIFSKQSYSGLFQETNGVRHESSGFFHANMTARGTFTAKLQLAGKTSSLFGKLDFDGRFTKTITRKGLTPLDVEFQVTKENQITGQIRDAIWTAELLCETPGRSPMPQSGNYTFAIPVVDQIGTENIRMGFGFGAVKVNAAGQTLLRGVLPDGTRIQKGSILSKSGRSPLYLSLYSGKGSIFSWLNFTNESADDFHGVLSWSKPAKPSAMFYPEGFLTEAAISGFSYVPPTKKTNLNWNFPNGVLMFSGGNLPGNITNNIDLRGNNSFVNTGDRSSLTIVPASGLFSGKTTDPFTGKRILFKGALLQREHSGFGFFLGTNQSGRVWFELSP